MRSFLKSQSIDCIACMSMLWLLFTTLRDVVSSLAKFSILEACLSRLGGGKVALIREVSDLGLIFLKEMCVSRLLGHDL
jgi:hypothetical protein